MGGELLELEEEISRLAYFVTKNKNSYYHPWEHTLRVCQFAKKIHSQEFGDYKIYPEILVASYFHDVGRVLDKIDHGHAYRSSIIFDLNKSYLTFDFDEESVRFAILNHCLREGETGKYPVVSNFPRSGSIDKRIAACLWDADRLDLIRIPGFSYVKQELLNTEYAKEFANTPQHMSIYRPGIKVDIKQRELEYSV